MLDDGQISNLLNRKLPPEQIAAGLIEAANNAGGRDNISVIVLKICDEP
jgi:protein phosphatase